MKYVKDAGFALWSLFNIGSAVAVAFYFYVVMVIRYDDLNTVSTAHDPDPNLTRAIVMQNVLIQSLWQCVPLAIGLLVFWGLNYAIYDGDSAEMERYRKMGFYVACACSLIIFLGIVAADCDCLNKYPQNP